MEEPPVLRIKPLGKLLLVEPLGEAVRTSGGIEIPERFRDVDRTFRVLAVGPKVEDIHPGDRVVAYSHHSGPVPLEDGTRRSILHTDNVLAVLPCSYDWSQTVP